MKKVLSLLLVFTILFCQIVAINVSALGDDVNLNVGDSLEDNEGDTNESVVSVSLEQGTDAGYFTNSGNIYTAFPYQGNEFLGWYKKEDNTLFSADTTANLPEGNYIAKFKDNNIVTANAGYELTAVDTNILGSAWVETGTQTWRNAKITDKYAKSGNNSLAITARFQRDIYADIKGLETDTYYIVSYYWMLPKSVITDTVTAGDGYYGSAIGTSASSKISDAYKEIIGGDYTGAKNINFVGGQWNKVEYVFHSAENTDLRMFLSYDSEMNTGNDVIYIDEFTVYKAPDQNAVATYKATVSAENGYAYSLETTPVKYDTEVTVVATPFGGYVFDGWYEDGKKVSSDKIYTFNIQSNRNLVAKCVPATATENYSPDMNSDGVINLNDVVVLAQKVAGWNVEINESVTDVNGDNTVNLSDVVLLAQYVAGWDVADQLPGESTTGGLPMEDLTDVNLKETLLSGNSEYYNTSTVINEGNKARLANVFKKAKNGEDITIVGFGGSITEGAGATSPDNQYGARVAKWFEEQFPNITVTYINSGIGSTTSLVGVHRMKQDVLDHDPDLVLVDFTTNDSQGDIRYRIPYETIIRSLLENDIAVVSVVFGCVNNYSSDNATGSNTRANNSLSSHLPSILYYDVPAIDFYGSLWRYLDAGVIKWTDVEKDYIHPNNKGHLMAASAINYYLSTVLNELDKIDTTVPAIPDEYFFGNDIYKTAAFLGGDDLEPTSNTNFKVGNVHGVKLAKGWICENENGGSITFEVKNVTSLSIFLQYKSDDPSTANVNEANSTGTVTVNGKTVINNANCSTGSTGGYIWLAYSAEYDTPQDVTITVTSAGRFGIGPIGVSLAE